MSILTLDQSITCIINTLPLWTSCSSLWCLELECQFCSQLLLCPSQLCSVLRSSCCITSSNNHLLTMSNLTIQSLKLLTRLQFYYCLLDIGFWLISNSSKMVSYSQEKIRMTHSKLSMFGTNIQTQPKPSTVDQPDVSWSCSFATSYIRSAKTQSML